MISDVEARQIASEWHGGGGSALYVLASSGAIILNDQDMEWLNVRDEVNDSMADVRRSLAQDSEVYSLLDEDDLGILLSYVETHGSRGPVEGWGNLNW